MTSRFTEMVGCAVAIQQAPMGGVASAPQLPVAVAAAGGMGMLSAVLQPAEQLATVLDELPAAAIGVNFLVPFLEDRDAVSVAAARMPLVDFFGSAPDPALVALVHAEGALAEWQVGSVEEARAAVAAGCDLVVAQGVEAGGGGRGAPRPLGPLRPLVGAGGGPRGAAGGPAPARAPGAPVAPRAAAAPGGPPFLA